MKYQWTWILSLLFAIIITIFAIINMNPVRVNFGFGSVQFPLVLVILGSAFIGSSVSGFYALFKHFELKRTTKEQSEYILQLERQVEKYEYDAQHVDRPVVEIVGEEETTDIVHQRKEEK